ncbi:MAG: DUF2218 domain-containing protein [Tetrasphaera sp.]|nr:DUF2218 domain-containing protein [Tetrasphaera sp.]
MRTFPDGFLFGVSTAGHQIEGDNVTSDTWFLEHQQPTVFREPSGTACNSYVLWESDLDLVADLHLDAYRFSIEWARVEPEEGVVDEAALAHYAAMVDGCLARGLKPVVTLNHFTSPHWFAARGGWLDPQAPDLFARYVATVIDRIGDRIAYAVTFNEPNLPHLLRWAGLPPIVAELERATLAAAAESAGVERYRAANVVLPEDLDAIAEGMTAGHRAARAVIKDRVPSLPVGLSLALVDDVVVGDDPSVRDRKRAEVYQRWLELARGDDFVGVQNYERLAYDGTGLVRAEGPARGAMTGGGEPASLAEAARYAYAVAGVPVLVTEHGLAGPDDAARVAFIEDSLPHLLDAMEDGVPVLGYLHWTLLDNFEWIFGYDVALGLVAVDRETFVRTPKPSASAYAAIAAARGVPDPVTSDAFVATDRPGRYGKQLAAHLGKRAQTEWDEAAGRGSIRFGHGGRADLVAQDAGLRMRLTARPASVERLEGVLGGHLVRFGARDELVTSWTRSDGTPGSEQRKDTE